jgi:hypothetical protein
MAFRLSGEWIGESMEIDTSPAHIWHIEHSGRNLYVMHRWEDETSFKSGTLWYFVSEDGHTLHMDYKCDHALGHVLDADHFIMYGWDTNDIRGNIGPAYDVVFSRQGLAELSAARLWRAWRDAAGDLE